MNQRRPVWKWTLGIAFAIIVLCALTVSYRHATSSIIVRVKSPDGRLQAVLLRSDPGAMNDFEYFLYVIPVGSELRDYPWWLGGDEPVLTGADFDNLKITWSQDRVLDVAYSKAIVYSFSNFWLNRGRDRSKHIVEIRLRPTAEYSLNSSGL